MRIIGLTGGIGTGKSTVSNYLKQHEYIVIDADKIAHQITESDSSTLHELVNVFGEDILGKDGTLDRKALGRIAFNDADKKNLLEKIVTNKVVDIVKANLESYDREGKPLVILDAPLLFETHMEPLCTEVWTVTSPLDIRISRVSKRDGLTKDEILSRINNQMSDEYKCSKSDIIFKNDKGLDYLFCQVDKAMRSLND